MDELPPGELIKTYDCSLFCKKPIPRGENLRREVVEIEVATDDPEIKRREHYCRLGCTSCAVVSLYRLSEDRNIDCR
jgi:hypothetical protein